MRWFNLFTRPARSGTVRRTRLGLEQLGDRALPSSLGGTDTPLISDAYTLGAPPPARINVQLINFSAEQLSGGYFVFSGEVDVNGVPTAGLTVNFGGIPSLEGKTVVTDSDGTFSFFVTLQTDGSDNGTATAQTTANGVQSNQATCSVFVSP